MKVVEAPRNSGKTAYMMNLSENTKQPLVCFSLVEKERVMTDARERSVKIPEPVTLQEVMSGKTQGKKVIVDNLDVLLSFVWPGTEVTVACITKEEER